MDNIQQLLQVSAQLFKLLTDVPKGEERTTYIEEINQLIDVRGEIVELLKRDGFQMDSTNKAHETLAKLDKGIRDGLAKVMDAVKLDMKDLQNSKKNERQYMNPYSTIQVMDGRYYDKRK